MSVCECGFSAFDISNNILPNFDAIKLSIYPILLTMFYICVLYMFIYIVRNANWKYVLLAVDSSEPIYSTFIDSFEHKII